MSFWSALIFALICIFDIIVVIKKETIMTAKTWEYLINIEGITLALLSIIVFTLVYLTFGYRSRPGIVWLIFDIALVFWLIAEFIYFYLEMILIQEPAFPSTADIFWIIGYPLVIFAFILQSQSLKIEYNKKVLYALIGVIAITFGLLIAFIGVPIFQESDTLFEAIIWAFYPLGDFVIFSVVIVVSLKFIKAPIRMPWLVLAVGFLCDIVADISYVIDEIYLEVYLTKNFIAMDIVYAMSYAFYILAGLLMYESLKKLRTTS
ncbi:MAG: hypothetical protein ACTSQE_11680 [Candidatus Heimdallarchaeaceae archaeon]